MVGFGNRRVVSKSCDAGESREVWLENAGKTLVVGEDSEGPLTQVAYGEPWHRCVVRFDSDALGEGFGEAFLASSNAPLCDLMDFLDLCGVPYTYLALGGNGSAVLRGAPKMNFSQTLDVGAGA